MFETPNNDFAQWIEWLQRKGCDESSILSLQLLWQRSTAGRAAACDILGRMNRKSSQGYIYKPSAWLSVHVKNAINELKA